jgi:hypothetical protein
MVCLCLLLFFAAQSLLVIQRHLYYDQFEFLKPQPYAIKSPPSQIGKIQEYLYYDNTIGTASLLAIYLYPAYIGHQYEQHGLYLFSQHAKLDSQVYVYTLAYDLFYSQQQGLRGYDGDKWTICGSLVIMALLAYIYFCSSFMVYYMCLHSSVVCTNSDTQVVSNFSYCYYYQAHRPNCTVTWFQFFVYMFIINYRKVVSGKSSTFNPIFLTIIALHPYSSINRATIYIHRYSSWLSHPDPVGLCLTVRFNDCRHNDT